MELTYDISKNKLKLKVTDKRTQKDIKEIIILLGICGTALAGFKLYLDYKIATQ